MTLTLYAYKQYNFLRFIYRKFSLFASRGIFHNFKVSGDADSVSRAKYLSISRRIFLLILQYNFTYKICVWYFIRLNVTIVELYIACNICVFFFNLSQFSNCHFITIARTRVRETESISRQVWSPWQ